ncbi:hypothetical protein IWQ61_005065 [Dispira simplex]|nr:hypothetical protein IWQ61_005065 [Dispira simplex]
MPLVLTDKDIPLAVHNDMVVNTPTLEQWLAFTFRTTSHGTMSDESTRAFQQSVHAYNGDCSSQLVARLVTFIPDTLSYYQFLIQPENMAQVLLVTNPNSAVLSRWLEIYGYLWLDPTVGTVCVRDTMYAMRFVNILCKLLRTLVESPPHGTAIPSLATQRALVRVLFLWTKCHETQLLPQLIQCEPLLTVLLDALAHHCHALEQLPCNTTIYFDHQTLIQDTLSILHFLLTRAPQPSKYLIKPLDPKTNTYRLLLPSFPTSATERVPLFYLYLETMGRLACRYEEHSLSPEFTNQAKDLLALVLTAQEEEQVLRLISPLN